MSKKVLGALSFVLLVHYATSDDDYWRPINETENEELVKLCQTSTITSRVIGGNETLATDYPAAAVLVNDISGSPRCGATLISPRHLLTSRACFENIKEMKHTSLIKDITLYAGGRCQQSEGSNYCKDKGSTIAQNLTMDVMAFSSDPNRYAELAVIQLKEDVTFGTYLRPVCLKAVPKWSIVYMTGFADPERKKKQKWAVLKEGWMQKASPSDAMYTLLTKEWCDSDMYACIRPAKTKTSATIGDSGSGLYWPDAKPTARWWELILRTWRPRRPETLCFESTTSSATSADSLGCAWTAVTLRTVPRT